METFTGTILKDGNPVAAGVQVNLHLVHSRPLKSWHGVLSGLPDFPPIMPGGYRLRADDGREGDIIITSVLGTPSGYGDAEFQGSGPFEQQRSC